MIVAVLLMIMEEHEAFWAFAAIVSKLLPARELCDLECLCENI